MACFNLYLELNFRSLKSILIALSLVPVVFYRLVSAILLLFCGNLGAMFKYDWNEYELDSLKTMLLERH